jgi:hypothetical protein
LQVGEPKELCVSSSRTSPVVSVCRNSFFGANIPLSEVGRVLGHTQANTTYRYVNANLETAKRAAAALDAFNAELEAAQVATESVN